MRLHDVTDLVEGSFFFIIFQFKKLEQEDCKEDERLERYGGWELGRVINGTEGMLR